MKIELSDDAVDDIVCATIKEHIKFCKKNIKDLKALQKKETLKSFQADDLLYNVQTLQSLQSVYAYFGGNL